MVAVRNVCGAADAKNDKENGPNWPRHRAKEWKELALFGSAELIIIEWRVGNRCAFCIAYE
jgi:hypothetical protein